MSDQAQEILEGLKRDWEEFKRTNTDRIKAEAKGVVDPLITEKLERINAALDAQKDAADDLSRKMQDDINRLKALESVEGKADGLTPEQREYKREFAQYLRKGGNESTLTGLSYKAMTVGSDADGGFWVTPDLGGQIVMRVRETSPIRQWASVQTISTDALEGKTDLGTAAGGWVSETGTRSASTTPQIGVWRIPVHEIYSQPSASQKLLDDANVNVEAWLAGKVADYIARATNTAFVTGNGVGKPRGFASYTTAATADDTRAWGSPEHLVSGTSAGFGTDPTGVQKFVQLIDKLNSAQYLANAAFYMNRTTRAAVRQLTDASSAGKFVFIPSFQANVPDTLLGYPIRILQDMASYSTADALAVAFGDMRAFYQVVDRVGLRTLRDPFTSKPYVLFYTTARVGGDVIDFNAMKFLKFST